MIIYLYGPDAYRRQEKLKEIVGEFKKKHSALTVGQFNLGEETDFLRLKDFATAQSLFDNCKLGIIYDAAEADTEELNSVLNLASESQALTLIISSDKAMPKSFGILNSKPALKQRFENLPPATFSNFAKSEADKRKLKLSPANLAILAKHYQGNSWGLITELDKLALGGSPDPVLEEKNFFDLMTALQKSRLPAQRLSALENLLSHNEPAMIFNFLASRADGKSKLKMADYDVAIKSGKLEYEEALLDAILI